MRDFYKNTRFLGFKFLFFIFVITIISACSGSKAEVEVTSRNNEQNDAPIAVTVERAVSREIPAIIQATGNLAAHESSNVAPKAAGKVVNVYVNVGDFVGSGSVIARLDDKDARLRVAEAEAGVKQSQAAVRQAEARLGLSPNGTFNSSNIPEVRVANANYEQAQAELRLAETNVRQAEVNEKRYRELVETGDTAMITYEQFRAVRDTAKTARETAQTRVNAARQNLEAAVNAARQNNQAIKSAQAGVEAARTQLATAQAAVSDMVVRAPFSGFISERQTAVGEFVNSSSVIAVLMRTNPIKVEMQVAEADVPYVNIGSGVSIQVDAYKDRNFGGTVTAVKPALDATSRAATVEAQIENGNNALRPGMFATTKISRSGGGTGVFVPKEAVFNDQATQNHRVFVIADEVVKLRVVQLGNEENGFYQILNGVSADEVVATSNLPQLHEGARVQIQAQ